MTQEQFHHVWAVLDMLERIGKTLRREHPDAPVGGYIHEVLRLRSWATSEIRVVEVDAADDAG